MNQFNYKRRKTTEVQIGQTPVGGDNPVRLQSMANTSTMDTDASVRQAVRIIKAGGEYVRFTAQGVREAENLANIKAGIRKQGFVTPLVADIHFNPKAADAAARTVDKVRINPGNFVDSIKTFQHVEYSDAEYSREVDKIRKRFKPLLDNCKANKTAIRIGVNHGSLSDRIMSRYGDTPEGMVESCLEFLRICEEEDFPHVVISIKASNTVVMVQTVRLLVDRMEREDMHYPLHLGVTEAGDGEDGRIRSAVGIGTLLSDGIGDTVRVSLSEEPEMEIPVARKLVNYIRARENHAPVHAPVFTACNWIAPTRRDTLPVLNIGGKNHPVVIADYSENDFHVSNTELLPDYIYIGVKPVNNFAANIPLLLDYQAWMDDSHNKWPVFNIHEISKIASIQSRMKFLKISYPQLTDEIMHLLKNDATLVIILQTNHQNGVGEQRAFFHTLSVAGFRTPVIVQRSYAEDDAEDLQIKAGVDFGTLLLDGFADGVMLSNCGHIPAEALTGYAFGILQAARVRTTKTEYISCPGCGRTLFNLQATIARVKAATAHLPSLKIGIMGCIVNGPGEMADADYGYVGAGKNKISLYKGKVCVKKNIPEEDAVEKLIELIKIDENLKEL
ncbi:MAG: 4-hydroxy-3-methylbut-2-en-1-yl diphosphate synthase [Bacteroidales bacterium]|nr:4-hydroxy-3-methylbut-2-en-1-yl diphosphate synthase [Bacteroidales bacterium]